MAPTSWESLQHSLDAPFYPTASPNGRALRRKREVIS